MCVVEQTVKNDMISSWVIVISLSELLLLHPFNSTSWKSNHGSIYFKSESSTSKNFKSCFIPRHLQVNLPCVCETWSHFLVSHFFGVEPHLRIAGGIHGIHGLDGVAVMAESFAKQLRGADARQVAQVLRQEIRSWCRGKIWGRVFWGGWFVDVVSWGGKMGPD